MFRSSTFARWRKITENIELGQFLSMFHTLDKKKAISYYAGVYGLSEPTIYTTHYLIGLNYRQNIYKDFLFFEILPKVLYQKTNNFRAEHSLTFRVEMVFKK